MRSAQPGGFASPTIGAGGFTLPSFASGTAYAPGGLAAVHPGELIHLPRGSSVQTATQVAQTAKASAPGGGTGMSNFGTLNLIFPAVSSAQNVMATIDTLGSA